MKFFFMLALGLFYSLPILAQPFATRDTYTSACGPLTVQPIEHATLILTYGDQVIYVDPVGPAKRFVGLPKPTMVLITDIHSDHANRKTLRQLDLSGATLVYPAAVEKMLPKKLISNTQVILANGQAMKVDGIPVEAVPMYNLPEKPSSLHPKGRGNGYLLSFCGIQVYLSGDTEDIPEMRSLTDVDIAFVSMKLPFTMTVEQAADAVLDFKPSVVYPYSYKGLRGQSDLEQFRKIVEAGNSAIEVRIRNWYPRK
ncbi:MAG TPA: MBL fold metallo-hydrolase [Cytophagales bacterium]|nr:MBL fold metallo-hydrolase [Cytophagales bacterium]HAA17392.1 MBL fold metallo-hydrolase [Cytophagales bacterium]HAP64374.1 MBL fold metallo-hydrolase [Cytophagales bacterium]